jgi:hypothetical protein
MVTDIYGHLESVLSHKAENSFVKGTLSHIYNKLFPVNVNSI